MNVFHRVLSAGMTKHMLRNRSSSHLIHMSCGRMTEKMGMQMFVNADAVRSIAKDILQCSWLYPFSMF